MTPTKFLQRDQDYAGFIGILTDDWKEVKKHYKDELKYIYVYAVPNPILNKAHEVNFNVHIENLTEINSYFEGLNKASKKDMEAANTVEDKLLNLQRALEHLRKVRLLKGGLKTQLDRTEHFHAGETEQAFRA